MKKICIICDKEFFKSKTVSKKSWCQVHFYCSRFCYWISMKGKKRKYIMTDQTKRKLSESHKGSKSYSWKGGITSVNQAIRNSLEYEEWRKAVFERDNYICRICGKIGGYLNADHIKPFAFYPELRFELSNGRTLCEGCHKQTDTFGVKAWRARKNLLIDELEHQR